MRSQTSPSYPKVLWRSSLTKREVRCAFIPSRNAVLIFLPCTEKTPAERAELLEKTSLFADIHSEAAQSGQSAVPTNLDTNLHFTCFVKAPAVRVDDASPTGNAGSTEGVAPSGFRVLELDGRREGIVDRGECKDLLHVRRMSSVTFVCMLSVSQDVAQIVKDNYMAAAASMEFSMMAFGPPPDW